MMLSRMKHLIIGSPLPTLEGAHRRLNKIRALAAFSPDALSSLAYATEEIFLALAVAAALLIDYVLPAAVSLTAGTAAIASAFPFIWPYRVHVALLLLAIIMLSNLRGLRETGTLLAVPVYLFVVSYLVMIAVGVGRAIVEGPGALSTVAPPAIQPLTLILIIRAFSVGCTALTGIEAISNGVPAFRPPESQNAGRTLMVMALLMGQIGRAH